MKNIFSPHKIFLWIFAFTALTLVACGGGGGGSGSTASSAPFAIASQPSDQSVEPGNTAKFSVVASTSGVYQWQTMQDQAWRDISGANGAELTITNVSSEDDGKQYRVIVSSNGDASTKITSSIVTLKVSGDLQIPVVTVQPADLTLTAGQSGSFSVTASGTSLRYLWQSSVDGVTWTSANSASNPNFTLANAAVSDSGKNFRVVVSNSAGSSTTSPVLLTVLPVPQTPTIATQPGDANVAAGQRASFSAQTLGQPLPALQWQSSVDGSVWTDIAGATGPSYSTAATSLADSGRFYRLVASNSSGSAISNRAQLTVSATSQPPVILTQPADVTVNAPAAATFSVAASGVAAPTYQWQLSIDGGYTFSNINGATSTSYSFSPSATTDNYKRYRVIVSNASGSVTSRLAVLTVNQVPTISQQPESGTWNAAASAASFGVLATGFPSPNYQWQVSTDGGTNYSDLTGATLNSYTSYNPNADRGKKYRVRISNVAGTVVSDVATLDKIDWVYANPQPTGDHLLAVAWSDANTAVAVGVTSSILRTTDAGAHWTVVSNGNWSSQDAYGIAFADSTTAVMVGSYGSMQRSTDKGITWASVPSTTVQTLRGIAFRSANIGIAVGDSGTLLRTADAGQTWAAAITDNSMTALNAVAMKGMLGVAVGDSGKVLRSTDGGASWFSIASGVSTTLAGIAFVDASTLIAVGASGTILQSTDAGLTWQSKASGSTFWLAGVQFNGGLVGVVAENQISLLRTTDGGATWSRISLTTPAYAVSFSNASNAIAVGSYGSIQRSTNGGATWLNARTGSQGDMVSSFNALAFNTAGVGLAVGNGGEMARTNDRGSSWTTVTTGNSTQLQALAFAGTTTVLAGGYDGVMLRSTNSGTSWSVVNSQTSQPIMGMAFADASTGLAVTAYGMVRSTDGGVSWSPVANAPLQSYRSVAFGSTSLAIAVGDGGRIVRSTDRGITWTSVASGTTKTFQSVAFANATTVVAVGDNGNVMRSTDAGQTWTSVSVFFDIYSYYGVTFSTEGVGLAVGSFNTILRSTDGGLSWTIDASQKRTSLMAVQFVDAHSPVVVGSGMVVMRGIGY
nr:YCF48-related protein [uncultured Albidiferax sp.]